MKKSPLRRFLSGLLLAPAIALAADPQISSFTDTPDPVATGTTYSYQIVVRNNAPDDAPNTRLSVSVPSGATFVSAAPASENCAATSPTLVECNLGTVRGANLDVRTITMVWQATAVGLSTINATATLSADNDVNATNNVQNQQTTVNPVSATDADLQITSKSAIAGFPFAAGSSVTFRITPRNAGPAAGTGVTVTDVLPAGWTFVSASGPNWSCSAVGQAVTCSRATLPVGAADDIDIVTTAPATVALGGSPFTNEATIAGTSVDPVPGNNSAAASGTVVANGADLGLTKSKLPLNVAAGGTLTSTITVTNYGPVAAVGNVRVVDVLAAETYVGSAGTGWACTAAGGVVTCNHANAGGLPVFGSLPALTITTTATGGGTATNTACTGGSVPSGAGGVVATPPAAGDPNPLNDCATTASGIGAAGGGADLAVASVTTTTPTGGDKRVSTTETSVTFTTVVRNDGPASATGTVVDFAGVAQTGTPLAFSYTAPAGVTFSCGTPPIRCTQTGGALAAGATVEFRVTASRPLPTFGSPGSTQTFAATVANVVENDPNTANNSGSDTFTIDSVTDLEVQAKTVSPSSLAGGELATYVIAIRNNGPDTAFGFEVVDTFTFPGAGDPGLDVVSVTYSQPSFGSCTAASAITPASPSLRCSISLLFGGDTQQITLVVRPRSDLTNPSRVLRNSATLSLGSVADGNPANDSRTAELTVLSSPIDLLVNKVDAVDPVPFVEGSTFIDYRVRVTNNGPTAGTAVRITENTAPPAGKRIRFVCDTTGFASSSCNATSLCSATNLVSGVGAALPAFTCSVPADDGSTTGPTVGNLANGATKDIFLRYEVLDRPPLSGDVFTSTSSVTSAQYETFVSNNSITELTTTRNRIDIRVSKAASSSSVSVSQPFNWVVTVVNNGPGDSLRTDLTDTLPAGTTISGPITWTRSLPAASGTCTAAGLTVSCALGRLNGTGTVTVTIPVRMDSVPAGGTATNTATVDVDPAKTGAEDLPGGNNTGTSTVTVARSSLSGSVFEDRSRGGANGGTPQAAAVEPRIAGVALRLTGTDNLGNAVDRTTTTDSSGNFTFTDLPPSNGAGYLLEQTQPVAYVNGPSDPPAAGAGAPSAGGAYSRGGTSGNSSYGAIVLGTGVDAVNYNFPEVRRPSLSGHVYVDVDGNGVRDAGTDTPIAGATVRLLDAGSLAVLRTATTDAGGAYTFTGLDPLTAYTLEEPLPSGAGTLANGPVNPGLIGGVTCTSGCAAQRDTPAAGTDRIATIDLSSGADGTRFDFGEIQVTAISGTVYVDRNRNGVLDPVPTDARLSGVTLTLYSGGACAGAPLATATTDASGAYSFGGLAAGLTYTVCQAQPAGYGDGGVTPGTNASSPGANALTVSALPAGGSAGNLFAERIGSVAGAVYLDANNDGLRQGGEAGIGGVQVTLGGVDATGAAVNRSATTDATGAFVFDDVVGSGAGGYTLTQQAAQPVVGGISTLNGRTTAGTVGGSATGAASGPGTTPSTIGGIVLAGGAQAVDHLFGEILPVSISGTVFSDANDNGQQDLPADPGLSGVTITLSGTDDLGAAVSRTLTTALDGTFSASGLRPGTYTLTQPTQPPGTSNGQTVAGSAGGTATGVATTPSAISGIGLTTPGAASTGNRFAERPDSGLIGGRVWLDANNDGIVDGTEAGIAGQTLQLTGTDGSGAVSRTTTTAADGSYGFTGLAPGTYTVTQPAQPAGTYNGRTLAGTTGGTATGTGTLPSAIAGITLAAGQSSLNNNFAELSGGQIGGRVWFDANNDGAVGAGESGIAGVTIQLSGTDLAGNPVSRTTATVADGSFAFADVPPGTYTLLQPVQPAGTFNGQTVAGTGGGTATGVGTLPSAISGIVIAAGQTAANNLFGETASGQIGGRVWLDANHNGVVDAGEAGLAGVTLVLGGTDALGNAVSATVTTATDGSYGFTGLRPGTYSVTEPAQPAGTLNGATLAGTAGGTATPPATTPSAITGIVLGASPTASNYNFAELPGAQIAGRVWIDADNDGVIDAGESGIAGVVLALSGTNDLGAAVSATATTAADGSYAFTGLRPGTYAVTEPVQPAGTFNGITRAGTRGGTASAVGTTPSAITGIVLAAGQSALANDFGEITGSQIAGRVWSDANHNGTIDAGEIGLGGVTLTLTGTDDLGATVSVSVASGADGSYAFSGLRPGTYTVTEPTQPSGTLNGRTVAGTAGGSATGVATTPSAISGIVLAAAQASSGNNFGEIAGAQIAGRVWLDANHNGVIDGSEAGIASVPVALTGTDDLGASVSRTTTTGADGSYAFTGLRPGTYAVTEPTQPAGTLNGRTVAGTAGGTATAGGTTPSAISGIVLAAAQASNGNNFGEIAGAQLAGRVWLDENQNGTIDGAEPGLGGVPLTLTGTDDLGGSVSLSVTSGADGSYAFSGLRPGTYTVTQPTQPSGTFNGRTVAGTTGGTATGVGTTPSAISGIVLAAAQASSGNNFGEISGTQITGRVWLDANHDGVIDSAESGIAGVSLLLSGTDDLGASVSRTVVTAADGSYAFSGLRPGTYTVTQPTQPSGTLNGRTVAGTAGGTATGIATTPSAIGGIVLAAAQASSGNNFGEIAGAQIAGRVWLDANHNGVIDGAEAGIAGVSLALTGTDDMGASVSRTTTTGTDGSYAFGSLRPGSYTVTEPVQPSGTLNGRTVAGTAGGTATGIGTTPSAVSGVVLAAGQSSSGNNFGEIAGAQLAGRVWLDANHNGVVDGAETGIAGVAIVLSGTDDVGASVSLSVTTGADGSYAFSGVRPGTYAVTQPTQPPGTLNGRTVAGTAGGTATGVGTTPSAISGIVLAAAQASSGNNFGEIPGAQVAGRVWLDVNNDGVVDGAETGIAGVPLVLSGTDEVGASVSLSVTSGTDGRYAFSGLRPGTYTVTQPTQPSGTLNGRTLAGTTGGTATGVGTTPSAISGVVLAVAQSSSGNNFGEIPTGQISGRVWADANNDAQIGSGEVGLSGVAIVLSGTDDTGAAISVTRTTAADGSYAFGDLRPGSYALTQPVQPPGTSNGATLAGSAGGVPTAVSTTPSAVTGITLGTGVAATGYLFGEIPDSADLLVSKTHAKAAFTVGVNGAYRITVRNGGSVATAGSYTVQDRLPTGMALAATPSGNGWTCAGAAGATSFSCSSSVVIPAGATRADAITVVVTVGAAAAAASPVSNVVLVEGGGEVGARAPSPAERDAFQNSPSSLPACVASVTHNACRDTTVVHQPASVSGTVWSDSGSSLRVLDSGDRRLAGWLVEVVDLASDSIVGRATTTANGSYRVAGLEPATNLAIRFREPASGVVFGYPVNGETAPGSSGANCVSGTPPAGTASSCVQTGASPQLVVVLVPGAELPQQSLPVNPTGVVYDSILRTPAPGSVVTLAPVGACAGWDPRGSIAAANLGGYTVSGASISMTVGADGFYQFLATPSSPANCSLGLSVAPPSGYTFVSATIPPATGPLSPAGGAGAVFAVQPQATVPTAEPGPATVYYLALALGSATATVVHNHIPLDPAAIGTLTLTKTGDRSVAEIGDSVRYTLTVTQSPAGGRPVQTTVVDRLPAGFTYIPGTASVNGVPIADPAGGVGPTLVFNLGPMPPERQLVLRYRVRVGVGAQQGDGVNRAQGHACQQTSGCVDASRNPVGGAASTNPAEFRVRVLGGVFTTDACVLGKIFVDCNGNHVQDPEELGVPGVRFVLSDGTMLISDSEGKYSLCGLPPRSHVLRVDPTTLPRGSRLTTSSNRNLGDAGSLWLDLKNGELHRADFAEGSCSNTVLEQTKARRAQGEVRSVETEKKGGPALRFDSKAHGLDTLRSPQQGTDGANQQAPKPRATTPRAPSPAKDETNVPTPELPMNQPPPQGRSPGDPPDGRKPDGSAAEGGPHGTR